MYDRRPASRAARGTPTVAAVTPVVRGSFHSAIVTPCRAGEGPVRYCRYIVDAQGDFKLIQTFVRSPLVRRPNAGLTPLPSRAPGATLRLLSVGGAAALFRRLAYLIALVFAVLVSAPASAAAPQPQRIIAVGDLHGDYQAWLTIARAAGLVDARGHWAAGKTIL